MSPPVRLELSIVEVVQRLSTCRDVDAVATVLRRAARELTGADGVTVILRVGDYCHYAHEDAIGPLWQGRRFPMYACISGTCMKTGRQIAIRDIYADERIPHDLYRPTFVRSLVVTPIRESSPLGALGAYWATEHEATHEELATLTALARSAAVAFENVALIESLTHANRRKDEFMVMLAHELRNPLAPALNATHVLRATSALGSKGTWAVDVIERQIDHLSRMTDELLDTSRIVAGKVRLQRGRVDLARVLREVLGDQRPRAEAAQVELDAAIPETDVSVQGDSTRLAQILTNVIDNAIKFTPACGRIEVRLHEEAGQAVLQVKDNGSGIDPSFLPHAFETFSQEDKSLERTRGGLGLGLAIARSLAEAHDGTLDAQSEGLDKGTQVVLRLPLDPQPDAIAPRRDGRPASKAASTPLDVLIVEDNVDAADSLKMLLELAGHTVHIARDGVEGVNAARANPPDVVLCDIGLPGLDGFGVARALRSDERTSRASLIAVTGYGSEDTHEQVMAAGFEAHMVKPVAPEVLLGKLERITPAPRLRAT